VTFDELHVIQRTASAWPGGSARAGAPR
jgi:hypothetical protein